eukprot:GEMP01001611.1.p1 GENE.GEMP01001611.1~~GEMP01001611.1.p1  ORF type:complete len:1272 (+),score=211.79 GEMP01001611.1:195-4010(+)
MSGSGSDPVNSEELPGLQKISNRSFLLAEDTSASGKSKLFPSNSVITSRYTLLTFIPKNGFEQFFYRPVNLYFVALVPLQLIRVISTSRGVPTVLNPLGFVLFVAALKDGIEDYRRHKSDDVENNRKASRMGDTGQPEVIRWSDVQVGDTLIIRDQEHIPADVILLDTSDEMGCAYVETSNLDGETNLKVKCPPGKCLTYFDTRNHDASLDSLTSWHKVKGDVECDAPNGSLYTFDGVLKLTHPVEKNIAVNADNIMLRGCKLRNTEWAICKVVYTGRDTKIQQNQTQKATKKVTLVEKVTLKILWCIFFLQCLFCTIGAGVSTAFETTDLSSASLYLNLDERGTDEPSPSVFIVRFLTFVLIFSNFIPISLMVTMSMVKFGQAFFILYDMTLVHNGHHTMPRTSDLNEELGQVDYIFSDKTGTLTQNMMEFRRCFVGGQSYGQGLTEIGRHVLQRKGETIPPEPKPALDAKVTPCVNFIDDNIDKHLKDPERQEKLFEFLLHMSINHTVVAEKKVGGDVTYSASSPDEGALVYGAKHFDFCFLDRALGIMTVSCPGFAPFKVEMLAMIDFTSTRKRSSTIAKFFHPIKQREIIMLYTKGADTVIEARLSSASRNDPSSAAALECMSQYALDGLRTLMFAAREVQADAFADWHSNYESAMNSMKDRTTKMELVAELLETGLELQAVTGIEDRLQDKVGETIDLLQQAGMKIWMLTGDKVETAVNIGVATGLIEPGQAGDEMAVFDWNDMNLNRDGGMTEEERVDTIRKSINQLNMNRPEKDGFNADILKNLEGRDDMSQEIVESITLDARGEAEKNRRKEIRCHKLFKKSLNQVRQNPTCFKTIVIDGSALTCILQKPKEFVEFTRNAQAVLCCRVSPDQKGQVVRLMRTLGDKVTLAIGDGANDCNMIRSAHVGVGIRGEEGLQAFNVCDYGIGQFSFLQGLVLVHGRYAYRRISIVVMYMFYKNIVVVIPQFLLGFHSKFSGMRLYLDLMYQVYNVAFTSLPVLVFGMMDNDVSRKTSYRFPYLYKLGTQNHYLNFKNVSAYVLSGFWHSIVVFYVPYCAAAFAGVIITEDGKPVDLWFIGTTVILLEVIVVNVKLVIESKTLNWVYYLAYFLGLFAFLSLAICTNFIAQFPMGGFEAVGVSSRIMGTGLIFQIIWLSCVIALLPDVYYKICEYNFFPSSIHKVSLPTPISAKIQQTTCEVQGTGSAPTAGMGVLNEHRCKFTYTPPHQSQTKTTLDDDKRKPSVRETEDQKEYRKGNEKFGSGTKLSV